MRETDLLAFQIAIDIANPAGVMCSYNHINSATTACENDYPSTRSSNVTGTSRASSSPTGAEPTPPSTPRSQVSTWTSLATSFFSDPLKQAVLSGQVPRLASMTWSIASSAACSRSASSTIPPFPQVVDPFRGRDDAQKIADESLVLLQNAGNILPL